MNGRQSRILRRSRPALLWSLFFFLGGQVIAGRLLYQRHPDLFDPEFHLRLHDLESRLAEVPGRPLALAVGSSRIACGLRPAWADDAHTPGGTEAVLFNFGMLGGGPVRERMVLHRLLRTGVRPKWLFVEVWAPMLLQEGFFHEEPRIFRQELYWPDLTVIARLYDRTGESLRRLLETTLAPLVHYRQPLLARYADCLMPPSFWAEQNREGWAGLDDSGWLTPHERPNAAGFALLLEYGKSVTKPLLDDFRVSAISDRALRDLLAECQANGIQPILFLMPEPEALRSWYPPATRAALTAYLRCLARDGRMPVIDAAAWCGDDEFADSCHLTSAGARSFSARFGRQVYCPLIAGQPLPCDVLLRDSP